MPAKSEWEHLVVGRGAADQLAGVISQIVSSKIMLELKPYGALKNVIIRFILLTFSIVMVLLFFLSFTRIFRFKRE